MDITKLKSTPIPIPMAPHTQVNETPLSTAVFSGSTLIVPILLAAGADPTLPPGRNSPLQLASRYNRLGTAAALCRLIGAAIEEPDRARALHRARTLRDLPAKLGKARSDARGKGRVTEAEQREAAVGAAPECLKGRVAAGTALPEVLLASAAATAGGKAALPVGVDEEARATVAFALDMDTDVGEGEGARAWAGGLPPELFVELMGYLLPAWADKGPDAAVYQPHERPPPSPLPIYHPLPPPVPVAPQHPQLQSQQQQQQQAILQQLQQFQQFIALQFQQQQEEEEEEEEGEEGELVVDEAEMAEMAN